MVRHLYNSSGEWIAFCKDRYVFSVECKWIGWIPRDDGDVVTVDGEYLGTIVSNNRLYRFNEEPFMEYPRFPGHPQHPEYPGCPRLAGYSPLPSAASDINIDKVASF